MSTVQRRGWLSKRGHFVKSWKNRWFVLRGKLLYYFEKPRADLSALRKHYRVEEDTPEVLGTRLKGTIPLTGASVEACEVSGKEHAFSITGTLNGKDFFLVAANGPELQEWLEAIQECITLAGEVDPDADDRPSVGRASAARVCAVEDCENIRCKANYCVGHYHEYIDS
eukprot:TRINITY_DN8210_c0_g1_i2.p1 TRINITY_DN8210_c0_g1~~TRINITY_DN8210_c0_g1_i2.p1  ORF type:complete len:169 (-),score=21.22 TRINITY_DN8210_c0_g1_i2:419-925(-)